MDRRAIPARRVQGRKSRVCATFVVTGLAPLVADATDDHPHGIYSQARSYACSENRTRLPVDHRVHPAQIRHRVDDPTTDLLGHQRPRVGDGVVIAASVDATLPFPGVVDALDAVVTTAGSPETGWNVITSPVVRSSLGVGLTTMSVPGAWSVPSSR